MGILLLTIASVLPACSSYPAMKETALVVDQEEDETWRRVKFRFRWPEGVDLDFSYHLLIADQILLPVLENHKDDIPLWRFHRRAARDRAGHQFSFIYYSNGYVDRKIRAQINQNPIVSRLKDLEVLEALLFTHSDKNEAALVEFTSDPDWPLEIQQSWPYFIMGVSESWLDLIEREQAQNKEATNRDIVEMLSYYQQLNDRIINKWGEYGRHAYLHHLNAIYGYTPVYIRESGQWQRF